MSRRSRTTPISTLQQDLFSFAGFSQTSSENATSAKTVPKGNVLEIGHSIKASTVARRDPKSISMPQACSRAGLETRVVLPDDLPAYPLFDQEVVDRSIAALPPNRIWFTYSAIKECFGISRATVARKVKKGLVPGIRFRGTHVLEDGPVRRFDRSQLRWLLLAVRSHQ
jgi:hypothetical protein